MDNANNTTAIGKNKIEARAIGEAVDIIQSARHLVELMFLAGESLGTVETQNAITTGCDIINDKLNDGIDRLEAARASLLSAEQVGAL